MTDRDSRAVTATDLHKEGGALIWKRVCTGNVIVMSMDQNGTKFATNPS